VDIWKWVHGREEALREDGHTDLADYIYSISNHAVNDRFDLVDQVYHAALPLCRALDDKWLEIYFRHWRLQAHVLKNYDAKGHLHEAISLLDFSHQEETKDCPQRICAVQDLASCYGIKDGPGFAEERISVCKETLAQIDGSWPCYECVSSELLDALMDAKKYKEAEIELESLQVEISKFNGTTDFEHVLTRTRLLLETGKFDAAWDMIKEAKNPYGGDGFARHVKLLKALTLCKLKRWEEAHDTCLPFDDIVLAATYYLDWTKIQFQLEQHGSVENNRDLRFKIHSLVDKLLGKDTIRIAFEICEYLVELCISADEKLRASFVIQTMKSLVGSLNRDLGASDALKKLVQRVEEIEVPAMTVTFETIETLLEHNFSNETQELSALDVALKEWPEDGRLIARKSDLLNSNFQKEAAYSLLKEAYKNHMGSAALESRYGAAYLARHGFEAFQSEFPITHLDGLSKGAIWNRGFKYVTHFETQNSKKTLEYLEIIETYFPEDIWLLGRIARQFIELENYDKAITYRRKQIALAPDNSDHKWNLLIAGTLNQNIPVICEMGKALDIKLDETGQYPADNRGNIRLQWKMDGGYIETYYAIRLGPALARITSVSNINDKHQLYGRIVVFDPMPLNKLDQKDDEGYACDLDGNYNLLFPPPLLTIENPAYLTYTVDGINPGKEALKTLSERIEDAGFVYHVWASNNYELHWKDGETDRIDKAIYIYILVKSGDETKLNEILNEFNKSLEHPFVWPELAEALKDKELRAIQNAIIEKYGIEY